MAVGHARGQIEIGDRTRAYSIIGSSFDVELLGEKLVGDRKGTITQISGSGWVQGFHRICLDPTDPYPEGFILQDTWRECPPPPLNKNRHH
jgi:proline racemase